jgi:hypothetical protein
MASKLPPSVEAVWKRKYYVQPDSDVQVADAPQHLSSFLHMVGIGADPDDTHKPKRVPVDPQSLARTIYEKEHAALHPTNTVGAGMGALVFDGAAVIDGAPYLVQACVVSAREARELTAASDHWDSDITGKKGTPRIPGVEWRAWQSYTTFRQRSCQHTSKEIDLRILVQRADEIDEHGCLHAPVLSAFAGARPIPTMPSNAPTPADIASYFRYHIIPLLAVVNDAHPEPAQRTFEIDRKKIPGLVLAEGIRLRLGPDAGGTPQLPVPEVASATNDSYDTVLQAGGANITDSSVPPLLAPTYDAVAPQKDSSAVIRNGELWHPQGQADDIPQAEAAEHTREPRKQKLESLVEPLAVRPSTLRSQAGQPVDLPGMSPDRPGQLELESPAHRPAAGSTVVLGSENASNQDNTGSALVCCELSFEKYTAILEQA